MPNTQDLANRLSALENGWDWLEDSSFAADLEVKGATSLATTAQMTAGAGITGGTGTVIKHSVLTVGNIIETTILIDLTGLNSASADDIIGKDGTAASHLGRITAAVNGTIFGGYMQCIEAAATGEPDIDLYSATEATGAEDASVTGTLTETKLLDAGADWTAAMIKGLTAVPAANEYLYLAVSGGADAGTYTAGKFVIKLYGYSA